MSESCTSSTFSLAIGANMDLSSAASLGKVSSRQQTTFDPAVFADSHKSMPSSGILKQTKPAMLNRASKAMRHHRSKLHLIDDTTLTSLPLPPPPSTKWIRRKQSGASSEANTKSNPDTPPNNEKFQSFSELSRLPTHSDVDFDDSFADSQDPIVLVEDYMAGAAESQSEETLFRKQSLANFKKRACDDMSRCSSNSTIDTNPATTQSMATSGSCGTKEDLEAMFGTIPGSEQLKHCTLCDKPLYEISSLMNSTAGPKNSQNLYNELVCSGCIHTYQQVLDEMHQIKIHQAPPQLTRTFNSLRQVYQKDKAAFKQVSSANNSKRVKRQFSRNLIGRLQNLSDMSSPPRNNPGWLGLFQEKFSWNH